MRAYPQANRAYLTPVDIGGLIYYYQSLFLLGHHDDVSRFVYVYPYVYIYCIGVEIIFAFFL
jgi:hypothetical protein